MKLPASEQAMRVVHLPARTPYVWKLQDRGFRIVNGTILNERGTVPAGVTATWLLEHRPLTWFDVLHLHHIEFVEPATLERLLHACADAGVRVVHTVHDLRAMFTSDEELHERLRLLDSADVRWVCLTHGSAAALAGILGHQVEPAVIPHGYVADPEHLGSRLPEKAGSGLRYLMVGAYRPNRDQLSTVVNWSLSTEAPEHELHLLMRGLSPAHFSDPSNQVPHLLEAVRTDPRIRTTVRGYPTDQEVIDAGIRADALLLPYLWGSHSGQLELAFDLNLLPVCSAVGFFQEQHERHKGLVTEPEWFDWSQGNPYTFGERFVAALERAAERLFAERPVLNPSFGGYRRTEHKEILNRYAQVYG